MQGLQHLVATMAGLAWPGWPWETDDDALNDDDDNDDGQRESRRTVRYASAVGRYLSGCLFPVHTSGSWQGT